MRRPTILLLTLITIASAGCRRDRSAPLPSVEKPLELLTGPVLDGPPLDLAALHGKVVVVNFWAPSWGVCAREAPGLQRIADELAPRGLRLVTIMMEGNDQTGRRFAQMTGLTAPIVVGTMELAAAWGMQVYPWTVIIGRDGKPLHAIRGGRKEDTFRKTFTGYL